MMIDEAILEERLEALERAVSYLQHQLAVVRPSNHWIDQVKGSISDEAAFVEALEYGRTFRYSDRPADVPDDQP
jgi:hypothetical protein